MADGQRMIEVQFQMIEREWWFCAGSVGWGVGGLRGRGAPAVLGEEVLAPGERRGGMDAA
jgi:hypothetical protein